MIKRDTQQSRGQLSVGRLLVAPNTACCSFLVAPNARRLFISIFSIRLTLVPMVTASAASHHSDTKHRALVLRTKQKFHNKFSAFECMKIAQYYAQVSLYPVASRQL